MNFKTFLEGFPIVRQIVAVLDDMNVIVAGVLLLAAGLVSESGIQNASDISTALIYLSGLFAAGYTVWDIIELVQNKPPLPPKG
jgi:hypothetical protein